MTAQSALTLQRPGRRGPANNLVREYPLAGSTSGLSGSTFGSIPFWVMQAIRCQPGSSVELRRALSRLCSFARACRPLILALLACSLHGHSLMATTVVVGGDPIGPDSHLTNNTGGFTAVRTVDEDLGEPAFLVSLDGELFLTELRVVVFGVPSPTGRLMFNEFDYHLNLWRSDGYFANADPLFTVDLAAPQDVDSTLR